METSIEKASEVASLQHEVEDELYWDPTVHAEHVDVAVENGVVQLTGYVHSLYEKYGTERTARRVPGVTAVVNAIEIAIPAGEKRPDADIAKAATEQLAWHHLVPEPVRVTVADGMLTLEGTVHDQFQKEAAEFHLRSLRGITGIVNRLVVAPKLAVRTEQRG